MATSNRSLQKRIHSPLGIMIACFVFTVILEASPRGAFAQPREGGRSAEAEAGPRRSPEAEAGSRRSAEAEAGPRRSAEAELGPRRSAEAEAGPRRSAEAEAGPRRSAEGAVPQAGLEGFRPQTEREAALMRQIELLQRELLELRREVATQRGVATASKPSRGEQFELPERWQSTKEGRVFQAYDKNGDLNVSLDEWLAMTNGNINATRRALQTKRYNEAEPSGDGRFTPAEFIHWYSIGRHQAVERQRGERAGEKRSPGEREGNRSPERDRT